MKLFLLLILFIFSLYSCDRKPSPNQYVGTVYINAKIINPRDSIGITDTIRVHFEVPDTILYNGVKTNINGDVANVGLILRKISPSFAGGFTYPTGSSTLASIGYLNIANNIYFSKTINKLAAEYFFLPKSKGVFFLEQQEDGYLSANNGVYTLGVKFNFGNINRNYQMLIDSAGPTANFNLFLQYHLTNNWEVYGFKVI